MKQKKIFVVIPAHNEQRYLAEVIKKTKRYTSNIVVVDDGSRDDTATVAKKAGAKVLQHIVNLGKGAALKTGCDYAIAEGADCIIAIDADAQHDPDDIPEFLKALEKRDVVLGYRKLNKKMPAILKFGNTVINKTIKYLYGLTIKDSQCGYRAFTAKAYKKLRWKSRDYSMESEMIAKISKYKLTFREVPIETRYPDRYKGTNVLDGIKIVINLFLWRTNNL